MRNMRVQIGVFLLIVGFVGMLVTWNNYIETKVVEDEYIATEDAIEEVVVKNRHTAIEVVPTTEKHVRVVWEEDGHRRKKDNVTVEEVGNRLEIEAGSKSFFPGIPQFRFKQMHMTIYIPEDQLALVDLTNRVGSVDVRQIQVDKLSIKTDVAKVIVREVEARHIHTESSVGAIRIENSTGDITATGNVGQVLVDVETVEGNMDLRSDVGEVKLILAAEPTNVSFFGSSEIGSVRIFRSGSAVHVPDPEYEVYMQTEVGSVTVRTR